VVADPPPAADKPAGGEPMIGRLRVSSTKQDERFLSVVQGADSGAAADVATAIASKSGTAYAGALVKGTAVLFPVTLGTFAAVTFDVPATTTKFLVTGLVPAASYDVAITTPVAGTTEVVVQPGTAKQADSGGVLSF